MWSKLTAQKTPRGKLADAIKSVLQDTNPTLYGNLEEAGDLENYIAVKADEAADSMASYMGDGLSEDQAMEMAMDGLIPDEEIDESPDEESDWTLQDDEIVMPDGGEWVDPKTGAIHRTKMALQVGTVVNKGGHEYVLNENHRWTRKDAGQTKQPQQPRPQLSQDQMKASMGGQKVPAPGNAVPNQPKQPTTAQQPTLPANAPIDTPPPPVHKSEIFGGSHNPMVDADPNHDGVTDRARVGVPAFAVPPPPKKIPRIPGLKGVAAKSEEHFASEFEKDPQKLIDDAVIMFTAMAEPGSPATFETDACKNLSPYWKSLELNENLEQRSKNRATLNTSLHQTANAIAKNAFLKHLDTLPEGSEILVTVGGCGAGKGFALKGVPQALELKKRAAVVWDSAGDQNATENPWILQEARKRGHKVSYVYVHSDPKVSWADPGRGVVKRAGDPNDGRMVDAMVFADSYAIGAKNHAAFAAKHATDSDVTCVFLKNGNPPILSGTMPPEALTIDRYELAKFAVDTIHNSPDIPEHVRQGALAGTTLWED